MRAGALARAESLVRYESKPDRPRQTRHPPSRKRPVLGARAFRFLSVFTRGVRPQLGHWSSRLLPLWIFGSRSTLLSPILPSHPKARSSAGEHFPDTEGVGGSIPPVPT